MDNIMKLPLGSRCIKYLMFIFNLFFVITGIILLSIGAVIHGVYHHYQHFLDNKFLSVPSLLIAIGAIIFFIAFFGCCGAVRENYCMIVTFTSLLVAVFIMELSGGISGYVLRSRASDIIQTKMKESMIKYSENNTEIIFVWDNLQRDFDCCGTNDPNDWLNKTLKMHGLPMSCCSFEVGAIASANCNMNSTTLHNHGCYDNFVSYIEEHAMQLGGVGIGIAIVQVLGIGFSVYLAKSIKNSYESV